MKLFIYFLKKIIVNIFTDFIMFSPQNNLKSYFSISYDVTLFGNKFC